jgi:uncharacterized protein YodC (DUF2158 family)
MPVPMPSIAGSGIAPTHNNFALPALTITDLYRCRWQVGVSRQGHVFKSVKVRPRLKDSDLVAWEAPWRETKTVEPSDNML